MNLVDAARGGGLPRGIGLGRPQFCPILTLPFCTLSCHAMSPKKTEASLLADLADQVKLMLDQLDQLDQLDALDPPVVFAMPLRPLAPLRHLAVGNGEPPWAALPPPVQSLGGARCRR